MFDPIATGAYLPGVITSAQIRAARALIGWKQSELAEAAGVSLPTVKNIEGGADVRASTVAKLQDALLKAGVVCLEPGDTRQGGAGVRLVT